jgi:hypothetical protein
MNKQPRGSAAHDDELVHWKQSKLLISKSGVPRSRVSAIYFEISRRAESEFNYRVNKVEKSMDGKED